MATVGTRVPPGVPVGVAQRWQGGLLVAKDTGPSFVEGTGATYPPADLMAPGPGGDATGVAAIAEYPGAPRAIVGFTEPQLIVTWSEESALRLRSLSTSPSRPPRRPQRLGRSSSPADRLMSESTLATCL